MQYEGKGVKGDSWDFGWAPGRLELLFTELEEVEEEIAGVVNQNLVLDFQVHIA